MEISPRTYEQVVARSRCDKFFPDRLRIIGIESFDAVKPQGF